MQELWQKYPNLHITGASSAEGDREDASHWEALGAQEDRQHLQLGGCQEEEEDDDDYRVLRLGKLVNTNNIVELRI